MRTYYYRYIVTPDFVIERGDYAAESVGAAVVQLRESFTVSRGSNRRRMCERVCWEKRAKDRQRGGRGVDERGCAIPFPQPSISPYLGNS